MGTRRHGFSSRSGGAGFPVNLGDKTARPCCASANFGLIGRPNRSLDSLQVAAFGGNMATLDPSLVAHLPLFSGFGADELGEILREARSLRFAKNSAVFEQGEDAHSFFVLLHGHVRASKTTPSGEQIVVRYVAPGETFGVATAIGLQRYPATATAVDDSVALAWPSAAWPRLVAKFPALAINTLQTVGSRLQEIPHPRGRDVDPAGRTAHRARAAAARQAIRAQGRARRRDRLSDQPAGHRPDDRHHAAYGEPHAVGLGTARADRERPAAHRAARAAQAVRAGRGNARRKRPPIRP